MHNKNSVLINIVATQNMRRKAKPSFFKPHTLFTALFGEREHYKKIDKSLGKAVEGLKSNLNQTNLSKAILPDADLSKGNMILTQLNSANLNGANLQYANLFMADLRKTLLKGANLSTAINITCKQIQSAVIDKNTQLPNHILITGNPEASYQCKNLRKRTGWGARRTSLQKIRLQGASLQSADFTQVSLAESLQNADFSQANLMDANLRGIYLKNANFTGTDLRGANLLDAIYITCEQIQSAVIDKNTQLPRYILIAGNPEANYQCKALSKKSIN